MLAERVHDPIPERRKKKEGCSMPTQRLHTQLQVPRPSRTQIGYTLAHEQFPAPELVRLAVAAEEAGFDAISTSDHFHPWQDNQGHAGFAWITLGIIARQTQRLHLGTAVTCPAYRYNPAVVAQAFATLSQFAPGRVYLGLGTGEALNEVPPGGGWGDYHERHDRLTEAVEIIRQLWTGEWVDFQGQHYQIKHARLYDAPPQPVPLYLAGEGSKSARMAGEYADGWITHLDTLQQPEARAALKEGARTARKDPGQLAIAIEHYVIYGNEDEAERWAPLWRFRGNSKLVQDPNPVDIERQAAQIPLKEVYSTWTVSADPQVHIQAMQHLIDAGASHVFVHSPQGDQRKVIEFFGREVLPQVQKGKLAAAR
jgi:TAT-translocated FGD2 family F420-dependent dehydrogenase